MKQKLNDAPEVGNFHFFEEHFANARTECFEIYKQAHLMNEPQVIEILKINANKAKQCAHNFNELNQIKECSQKYRDIESQFTEKGNKLLQSTIDAFSDCEKEAGKALKISKDTTAFTSAHSKCITTFKKALIPELSKLIGDELASLKALK